jgi:hypothetical protein
MFYDWETDKKNSIIFTTMLYVLLYFAFRSLKKFMKLKQKYK